MEESVRPCGTSLTHSTTGGEWPSYQLEEFLGAPLFHRRPFELTPPGMTFMDLSNPSLKTSNQWVTNCAGARPVYPHRRLRDRSPRPSAGGFKETGKNFPKLRLTLREGYHPQLVKFLQNQDLDIAITLLTGKPPAGISSLELFKLPLV